ncbi:MAG: HlyD family efflux transporter periplasmic adaptor subunit [Planctomycetes bacterium]|nr:HlyD family efflux transporter periplasmic adaptor subunit [Planctomycetota bacterium]
MLRYHLALCAGVITGGVLMALPASAESIEVDSVLLASIEEREVPAQEAGVLSRLAAREGAFVQEGELLAQIDDADARLELARAEIELENARRNAQNNIKVRVSKKAAEVAAAELKRALASRERYPKSVSETEVDRLRLAAEHADLQVEQAEYELETAQLALRVNENEVDRAKHQTERRRIVAPISGRVVQIFRRSGEWVEPGQSVLRLLRIDRLKAVGFLDATQLTRDLTGRPVKLRVKLAGDEPVEFPGEITFVHSEVNPVNGQVDFWAEIENRDLLLRPGLKATLVIE